MPHIRATIDVFFSNLVIRMLSISKIEPKILEDNRVVINIYRDNPKPRPLVIEYVLRYLTAITYEGIWFQLVDKWNNDEWDDGIVRITYQGRDPDLEVDKLFEEE